MRRNEWSRSSECARVCENRAVRAIHRVAARQADSFGRPSRLRKNRLFRHGLGFGLAVRLGRRVFDGLPPVGSAPGYAAVARSFGSRIRLQAAMARVNCQPTRARPRWRVRAKPGALLAQAKAASIRFGTGRLAAKPGWRVVRRSIAEPRVLAATFIDRSSLTKSSGAYPLSAPSVIRPGR